MQTNTRLSLSNASTCRPSVCRSSIIRDQRFLRLTANNESRRRRRSDLFRKIHPRPARREWEVGEVECLGGGGVGWLGILCAVVSYCTASTGCISDFAEGANQIIFAGESESLSDEIRHLKAEGSRISTGTGI